MASIKYRYAIDVNQQIVDVFTLDRNSETRDTIFFCLGCGNTLIPVLGRKRKKHFRHKVNIEVNCSPETYLHKLAKIKFYEVYKKCLSQELSFTIEYQVDEICTRYKSDYLVVCERGKATREFDLTKYFRHVRLEERENTFIPDVLLIGNNEEKLFIELAVTHKSTLDKIQSGYRIIELDISSESDINLIEHRHISEKKSVRFYNFKTKFEGDFCAGACIQNFKPYSSCPVKYSFFVIYENGKSIIINETLPEFNRKMKKSPVLHYEVLQVKGKRNQIYIEMIVKAFNEKHRIKNCYLCRYHGSNRFNYDDTPIFCKFLKKSCNSNEAASCQYYRPDPKAFPVYS